jgi:hypothetical protein
MTDLSPAAQAVLDAAFPAYDDENLYFVTGEQHAGKIAAAALRAAADQCTYQDAWNDKFLSVEKLRAIAAELHLSFDRCYLKKGSADIIRRALEALPDD